MMVAWLVANMLAGLGCEVVGPAGHVNRTLTMIATETIDAAVLDLNLGGVRSYPIADALTERGIPFVFATGYGEDGVSTATAFGRCSQAGGASQASMCPGNDPGHRPT